MAMRHPRYRHWLGPAAGSLLAHGVGVALGVRWLSGDLAGHLDGVEPLTVREPVTLRITAVPVMPEPVEIPPPPPEEPEPVMPEPVVIEPEPPMPPEEEIPPDEPVSMEAEAPVPEEVPPPSPEPRPELDPKSQPAPASKPARKPNPPSAKPRAAPAPSRAATAPPSGAMRLCTPADYLRRTAIRYPDEARRSGWQGRVMLAVSLDADGRPTSVSVVVGSGQGVLDEAARRAVTGWRFRPERVGGNAVPSRVLVPVRFALD